MGLGINFEIELDNEKIGEIKALDSEFTSGEHDYEIDESQHELVFFARTFGRFGKLMGSVPLIIPEGSENAYVSVKAQPGLLKNSLEAEIVPPFGCHEA